MNFMIDHWIESHKASLLVQYQFQSQVSESRFGLLVSCDYFVLKNNITKENLVFQDKWLGHSQHSSASLFQKEKIIYHFLKK